MKTENELSVKARLMISVIATAILFGGAFGLRAWLDQYPPGPTRGPNYWICKAGGPFTEITKDEYDLIASQGVNRAYLTFGWIELPEAAKEQLAKSPSEK